MRLAIFGRDDDALSDHTEAVARARGHDVLRVAFGALQAGVPAAFDGSSFLWQGEDLATWEAFVLRQYPAPTALLAPPDETLSSADWYRRGVQQNERSTFAQSALLHLEALGRPIVNPLGVTGRFEHKPLQLATFQRAGLPIPRTLVTNFPAAVRLFADDVGGELITKPVAGGAETLVVDDALYARLDAISSAPAIFQQRIVGADVRVTVVGDRVVSSVEVESEDGVDYRRGAAYRAGASVYRSHALPADVASMSLRAAALCGHVLSGIDWKAGKDGYVILEANSAPVYLDIEHKTGAPITEAVLAWLEQHIDQLHSQPRSTRRSTA